MRIWLTRHGQTNLNKKKLMQGLVDEPLNETGIEQAIRARQEIGNIEFDAVYSSPLERAIQTASIIGNVDRNKIIIDPRIIEVDFGNYERKKYSNLGFSMTLFWLLPELIPAPNTVEPISLMKKRSSEFIKDLEKEDYQDILVVCHGGIIRALSGYLEGRKSGLKWRPKPRNCELRVYEFNKGNYKLLKNYNDK